MHDHSTPRLPMSVVGKERPAGANEPCVCAEAEIACDEKSMDLSEKEIILKAKQERLAAITKGGLSLAYLSQAIL